MSDVVQKLWGFCHVLRHDGVDYGDYIEQITYLLFIKMADERGVELPKACSWPELEAESGTALTDHYADVLRTLGKQTGILGDIFAGSMPRFSNPVNLKRLITLIDETDQMCAGVGGEESQKLMFLAAGNLRNEIMQPAYEYHRWNCERGGIEDPGQAWNAVTVGAFTEKVFIQHEDFRGWQPVAQSGDLCPTSRTSLPWPAENQSGWPLKPDIVMEGGNYAQRNDERVGIDDLSLLTTGLPPIGGRLLQTTRDTSPATASAARMAAIVWSYYPRLWPETVRALMVHSARWTPAMTGRYPTDAKSVVQRCLRCYGYGVPNLQRALWSAENAATLIYEGELQPYQKVGYDIRANEMHLHTLPWPIQVLQDLGEAPVTMRVTLSYFIEPSPGRVGWTRKHRYQSHGLRFDVIRPTEDVDAFMQRLSRARWEDDQRPDNAAETRNWTIGDQGRRRGSLHSDWWTGTASELASCNSIAIYPVTGWWRERPHLDRWGQRARYSLIVSIESPDVNIDLYTPIANQTTITTELA